MVADALTKSRSDVSRPTDAFRNIVDAKLLNRASLHRLFRCAPTSWLPTRSPRAAPMFLVLRTRFSTSAWGGRFRNIVDAKLLNRAPLHLLFRVGAPIYVPDFTVYLQDIF
jgi:hypothetical protein